MTSHLGQSFQRHLERKKSRLSNEATPTKTTTADMSMGDESFLTFNPDERNIETLTRLETQHKEELLGLKNALKRRESELVRIDDLLSTLEERRGALQNTLQELQPTKHPDEVRPTGSKRNEEIADLEQQLEECRSAREECLEELAALKNALDRRGNDLTDIIAQKDRQIHDLLGRLEESHCAREESLMELHVLKTTVHRNENSNLELVRKEQEIKNLQAKLTEAIRTRDKTADELRALKTKSGQQDGDSTKDKELKDLSAKLEASTLALEEKNEEMRQLRKKYGATIQKLEAKMMDMADLNSKLYEQIEKSRQFEKEIERSKREKARLSEQLVVVEKEVVEKSEKISQLDELVKRLEDNMKSLGGERTSLLTTMASVIEKSAEMGSVSLLQQQLASTQSQLAVAQEQYTQAKDKVTLLEKKIEDTDKVMTELKIDLRIATRNLNRYEKQEKEEKSDVEKYQTEAYKFKEQFANAEAKIKELENQQKLLEETLKEKESEIKKNEEVIAQQVVALEKTSQELQETKGELAKVNSSVDQYKMLGEQNEEAQKVLKASKQKLAEKDRKIKQLQSNIDLLKETCTILESQLKDFETAITAANSKVDALTAEKAEVFNTLTTTKEALRTANLQINEQKSLRIFNEKQIEQLKARLNSEELEAHSQVTEINEQLAKSVHTIQNYEEDMSEMQAKCNKLEEELISWKNEVERYKTLMTTSKSESSTFLMQIVKLKEANIALQNGFEESLSKCEQLKTNIKELNDKVATLTAEKMDANVRFECVVQQQNKLIDHLQQQLEQLKSKKSRGFVERIFGHGEKSENATPLSKTPATPFGKSRTLETPLKRPDFSLAPPTTPAKVLSEIQNVSKKTEVVEDTRRREDCVLLKEEETAPSTSSSNAIVKTLLYHEDTQLDINCCHFVQQGLYVAGCVDGLYSVNTKTGQKTKIEGVDTVWAISFETRKDFVVAIEGPERNLVRISLGLLRACAEAAECSKPKITSTPILKITNAYMFKTMDSYIAVAGEKYLKILTLNQDGFHVKFNIQCPTNVTSLLLTTQQTLLFGTDLVYELDLLNGQVEEFMDSTDNSLQVNLANCTQFKQYPLAILDLTPKAVLRKNPVQREYLIAFPDFGIFLDENGRRTREMDIIWSKLPSCIEYHEPNLYVEHFTCIEVLQLNCNSFTKTNEPSIFLHLKTPKLLGSADSSGSMIVVTTAKNLTDIYKINYPRMLHPSRDQPCSEVDTSASSDGKGQFADDATSMGSGSTNTLSSF